MKKSFLLLFTILSFIANSQIKISGKVVDENDLPLEGASVYLNNTTKGTTTNDLGEFDFVIKEGVYDLIVSFIGYQTLQYQLDTKKPNKPFLFKTIPATNMLDEIRLNNKKYSADDRAYFLSRFKKTFLGETELSEECIITNLDVIQFDYNASTRVLEAFVNEPIEIINKGLGYKISYNLIYYELTPEKVIYQGYSKYEDLKGSKRKRRKWEKNRLVAYNGSKMHFIRSARKGNFLKEGFVVDQYQRIPNPKRPTDSVIKETRKYLRSLSGYNSGIYKISSNLAVNIKDDRTKEVNRIKQKKRDSAMAILRLSRLKKFVDKKLRDSLVEKDFMIRRNKLVTMKYDHLLYIKYMNEKEEDNFRPGPNRLDYQITKLILLSESVILDKAGVFIQPLDVFTEGYWGYEKTANALPLDYIPKE